MKVEIVDKQSRWRVHHTFIKRWCLAAILHLPSSKIKKIAKYDLITVVLVSTSEMARLNKQFRKKNKPTDVLSFVSSDPSLLGEIVLCREVIKRQSKEHELSLKAELGYMLIHGLLHLLGYDHELDQKRANKMFLLQDKIFDVLVDKFIVARKTKKV